MSSRNFLIPLVSGLCLTVTGLQARELPFELDLGFFRAAENRSRLDVYLGIDRSQITYERERGRYAAHLAGVVLLKQRGQIIDFQEITIDDAVDRLDDGPPGVITKQATLSLVPGSYDLQVVVEDRQGNRSDSTLQVELPAYGGLEPGVSTLQLARLIWRSTEPKEFYKRGLTVWPNAGAVYDDDQPLLWYYAEVYGLTPLDTIGTRALVWRDSAEVISQVLRWTPSPSMVFSDWGAVNLSTLAEGNYHLTLIVTVDGDSISVMKPFRVVREAPIPADSGDVLMTLSTVGLADFARGLSLLQPELDIRRFRTMDSTAQLQLVRDVAGKVAQGLAQDSSRYLAELLRRWDHVKTYDRDWRSRSRLTEQGCTMFLYGLPATIETYPATSALREYQIWTYSYPDSTAQFIFMDRKGYGEFTLVHATAAGTVRNENWHRELSWVPIPASKPAPPAAEVIKEEPATAVVDTVRAEPAAVDSLIVPAEEFGGEGAVSAVVDTAMAEPTLMDTLAAPELEVAGDTLMTDTSAVQMAVPDTAAVDTPSVDSSLLEPAINDTIKTP